jgi:DNA polymerase elongation subunit (family B)
MKFYTNVCCYGSNVLLKEFDNGKRKRYRIKYHPTLYVPGKSNSEWHTLVGDPVEPIHFNEIKEAREFIKDHAENDQYPIYGNSQFQYSFIAEEYPEHDLEYSLNALCIVSLDLEHENEQGFTQDDAKIARERINVLTVKEFNVDIFHVFTFVDGKKYNKKNHFVPKSKNIKHYEFESEKEMLLGFLEFWNKLDPDIITGWNSRFFDIPYLYNRLMNLFDEKTAKKLSTWGIVQAVSVDFNHREWQCYEIYGISQIDYYQIYVKNIKDPRENYKLDYIAKTELKGEGKVDWREKYETMKEFYEKDFQWFTEYNIQDVNLIEQLEKKVNLIALTVDVAYLAKVNFMDVLAQVRTWDVLIFNWLHQEKIVIPQKEYQEKKDQYVGAYVKPPNPGVYESVVSFDVASLYPNIIRVLNIGPEVKLTDLKMNLNSDDVLAENDKWEEAFGRATSNNCTSASNGVFYSKEKQSFYSRMVETIFTKRKKYQADLKAAKKELERCTDPKRKIELENLVSKLDVKQKATKILLNSLYGAYGNPYFRWYDLDNAEAVTMTGQFIIQYIARELNRYFNDLYKTENLDFVIYSDTDSVYVSLDKLIQHVFKGKKPDIETLISFLDKVCKTKLEPLIDQLFSQITNDLINGMKLEKPILSMKREVLADRGIWASKKHYALQVWNSEGDNYFECNACHNEFSGPSEKAPPCNDCKSKNTKRVSKLKIMGFDLVKSSTPQYCRDAMRKAVQIMMTGTQFEMADFIETFRQKFMKLPVEDIARPRGVNNLKKWEDEADTYKKGTDIGVKAVLIYNKCLEDKKLQKKYPPITSSERIKYVYLKQPNPIDDQVIAFNGKLPPEFGLHKYVDYEKMYEKTFINPIEKILDPIGWSTEKIEDMDKFFV